MEKCIKPHVLPFADILYFEGKSNYTQIYFRNGKRLLVCYTLKHFEALLADYQGYIRTHKSFLVNLQLVKNVEWHAAEPFMTLSNNDRVAIARRKRGVVRKRLKGFAIS